MDSERLDILREYRTYSERMIERCDGTLRVAHLAPYHNAAVRQRRDAARLAAHYTAQIERIEACVFSTISTISPAARHRRNSARRILPAILRWLSIARLP